MAKTVLVVLVGDRTETAGKLQQVLSGWGCIIKTRLGIHDVNLEDCPKEGLLVLELAGSKEQNEELARKIGVLPGVSSKLVELAL